MSDLKSQRNVAIGVAALAVAFVVGYLVAGAPRHEPTAPASTPETAAAEAPTAAPGASALDRREGVPEVPAAVAAEPARHTPSTTVGARTRQEPRREAVPATETGAMEDPVAAAETVAERDEPAAMPEEPQRQLVRVTVPAGTKITLTMTSGVTSQTAQVGDEVSAELAEPIRVDGRVVVASGTRVVGRVTEAQALRKVGGKSILGLSFDRMESGDGGVAIAAAFRREGKSETGKDAATIAAGAAIGAILGNQAKHNDRGKLIGAAVGAAAGTAVAHKTQGETIDLPVGSSLELTLREDVGLLIDG